MFILYVHLITQVPFKGDTNIGKIYPLLLFNKPFWSEKDQASHPYPVLNVIKSFLTLLSVTPSSLNCALHNGLGQSILSNKESEPSQLLSFKSQQKWFLKATILLISSLHEICSSLKHLKA